MWSRWRMIGSLHSFCTMCWPKGKDQCTNRNWDIIIASRIHWRSPASSMNNMPYAKWLGKLDFRSHSSWRKSVHNGKRGWTEPCWAEKLKRNIRKDHDFNFPGTTKCDLTWNPGKYWKRVVANTVLA